jgi:hypothetical protein
MLRMGWVVLRRMVRTSWSAMWMVRVVAVARLGGHRAAAEQHGLFFDADTDHHRGRRTVRLTFGSSVSRAGLGRAGCATRCRAW